MTYATPLQAGTLNRQVTIEQRNLVKDTFGQQVETWTTFATTRASIEPLSGAQVVAAGAQLGETMVQVVMRWRPGVTAAMRVRYQGAIYSIVSVLDEYAKHRKLTLLCQEGLKRS